MSSKLQLSFVLFIMLGLLVGCQAADPVCPIPSSTPVYLSIPPSELPTPTPSTAKQLVKIGNSEIMVDKVVDGALCNDTWSGIIYITCNVKVYPWVEQPTFLKDCRLNIDPQSVVYVAYHNNSAYYQGCSCHTGETPAP